MDLSFKPSNSNSDLVEKLYILAEHHKISVHAYVEKTLSKQVEKELKKTPLNLLPKFEGIDLELHNEF